MKKPAHKVHEKKPGPFLTRKTYQKNSNLFWSESSIGMFCERKLREHMESASKELRQLFKESWDLLPSNSELSSGGIHGSWIHCPNDIADQAESIIHRAHDEYRFANYNELDLRKIATADARKKELEKQQAANQVPETQPDYFVEQSAIDQLAMQVADAVYQAVKSRLSAKDGVTPLVAPTPNKEKLELDSLKGWYFVTADSSQLIGNQGIISSELLNGEYLVTRFSWESGEETGAFVVNAKEVKTYFTLTSKTAKGHDDFCASQYHRGIDKKLTTPPYEIGKGPITGPQS